MLVTQAKPESGECDEWTEGVWRCLVGDGRSFKAGNLALTSALEMSESSYLCASSDGMLLKLAKCTQEGEWDTGDIWQKEAEMPETPTPGTEPSMNDSIDSWSPPPQLKTQQRRKVSLREGSQIEGRRLFV